MAVHTVTRHTVKPSRTYDFLYDPLYTVSNDTDHYKSATRAITGPGNIARVPVFSKLFSELPHQPRLELYPKAKDDVPEHVNRQWTGYNNQVRDAIEMHKKLNYEPDLKIPAKYYDPGDVTGRYRAKYFRRPMIPFVQQVPANVILDTGSESTSYTTINIFSASSRGVQYGGTQVIAESRPASALIRNTYTQTDYRDSEAQTDPYTPEFVVRPGSQPELLTLATLSWGKGLPAGLAEVEMIERAREKRAWEAALPPLDDPSQWEKRRKMMDAMETNEWSLREKEIERIQEARLEVLRQLLRQREENHDALNKERIDRKWTKLQKTNNKKVAHIRHEFIRAIRKLTKKRANVENNLERRDVVRDYKDPGSQQAAPLTRIGVFLDRNSENFVAQSKYLNTFEGLLELESQMPRYVTQPSIKAPRMKKVTSEGFVRRKYRIERELDIVYDAIQAEKSKGETKLKPLRFLEKIEKPKPRPPTPSVTIPNENTEEKELAVIYMQQLIRGRAVQNMVLKALRNNTSFVTFMRSKFHLEGAIKEHFPRVKKIYEGKEKRKKLIKELRDTHALQDAEIAVKKLEREETISLQRQRRTHELKEAVIDENLSWLEGSVLDEMFDFLSKELIRLQEERRIHAFAMLAERKRRIREAEESGRRQVEERRRREEDEIFKQVVKVHQNTVDQYLTDVISGTVDHTASDEASTEIEAMAEKINDVAYDIEERKTELQSEEIVAELVQMFLLPEVRKVSQRERIQQSQRGFLLAAHREIYGESENFLPPIITGPSPSTQGGGTIESYEPEGMNVVNQVRASIVSEVASGISGVEGPRASEITENGENKPSSQIEMRVQQDVAKNQDTVISDAPAEKELDLNAKDDKTDEVTMDQKSAEESDNKDINSSET